MGKLYLLHDKVASSDMGLIRGDRYVYKLLCTMHIKYKPNTCNTNML